MARQVNERHLGDRTACLAILLEHAPERSWRSLWHIRCNCCGRPWETAGQLVGCETVQAATAELAGLNLPGSGRYQRVWPR